MDWKWFIQIAITAVVALVSGWIGHRLSSKRDLTNERRKLRTTYLLDAYRKLENASNRPGNDHLKIFESAIADIQLLGSPRQVNLARQFAIGMSEDSTAPLDDLISDLRQSLRHELELEPVSEKILYLRVENMSPPSISH